MAPWWPALNIVKNIFLLFFEGSKTSFLSEGRAFCWLPLLRFFFISHNSLEVEERCTVETTFNRVPARFLSNKSNPVLAAVGGGAVNTLLLLLRNNVSEPEGWSGVFSRAGAEVLEQVWTSEIPVSAALAWSCSINPPSLGWWLRLKF